MEVSLIHIRSDGKQREVGLRQKAYVIGRGSESTLRIPVSSVSRKHCEVRVEGDEIGVRDLGSSNGTYVNGEKTDEAILHAGDVLLVGTEAFVVRVDGDPGEVDLAHVQRQMAGQKAAQASADAATVSSKGGIGESLLSSDESS
ncbi:MAG: FHA domain-containing protein, partial [Phycisphaerales bacterium]|nr:FHA domain-containing protein [Phycisphaerales bacterium]